MAVKLKDSTRVVYQRRHDKIKRALEHSVMDLDNHKFKFSSKLDGRHKLLIAKKKQNPKSMHWVRCFSWIIGKDSHGFYQVKSGNAQEDFDIFAKLYFKQFNRKTN